MSSVQPSPEEILDDAKQRIIDKRNELNKLDHELSKKDRLYYYDRFTALLDRQNTLYGYTRTGTSDEREVLEFLGDTKSVFDNYSTARAVAGDPQFVRPCCVM